MVNFEYINATSLEGLPELLGSTRDENVVLAGGTDLLDRLKERLTTPQRVVNIKDIPELRGIETGGGVTIGALTTIAEVAAHEVIRRDYPVLAQAAASIATPQLRNMGTIGGNLAQRPRCWYFRGKEFDCLKKGGSKCFAKDGLNKYHAIFGGGPCYIVHPSDSAPALLALGASLEIVDGKGAQQIPLEKFFLLPKKKVRGENLLRPDQLITRILVPAPAPGTRSGYLKFREKQSLDFAVSSVAAVLQLDGGKIKSARIVLGGVAPVPWRAEAAEAALKGKPFDDATIAKAAAAAVQGAEPLAQNGYKVLLTRNLVQRLLEKLRMEAGG